MATLPEALLLWAESDPAAFDDEQQSGDDSAGVAGYLPAQRIAELLQLAVENGDVPYEGDLSEDERCVRTQYLLCCFVWLRL